MQNWRVAYIFIFILAIAFMVAAFQNDQNNMAPYGYLNNASDLLGKAQDANTLEQKLQYINESIATYGQGPNLDKLQLLASLNTTERIDLLLPIAKSAIYSECASHRNFFYALKVAISEIAFAITAIAGILVDWDHLDDNERHIVWGFSIATFVLVLMLI